MLFLWWWQLRWRLFVCESVIVAYSTCIYAHTKAHNLVQSNTISCELPCLWRPRVLAMPTFIQESAPFGLRVPAPSPPSPRLPLPVACCLFLLPSASVKLLAASEIHTNSIHFKCTCRQLPKKVRRGSYSRLWQKEWDGDRRGRRLRVAPAVVVILNTQRKMWLVRGMQLSIKRAYRIALPVFCRHTNSVEQRSAHTHWGAALCKLLIPMKEKGTLV